MYMYHSHPCSPDTVGTCTATPPELHNGRDKPEGKEEGGREGRRRGEEGGWEVRREGGNEEGEEGGR